MPTYEYECTKCGHVFEEFQSITADPLTDCPREGCDGKVRRLISPGGGFLLKGDGFYSTDYRSESYKKAEKAEKDSSSKSNSSGDTKKPADSTKPGSSSGSSSTASSSNT